MIETYLLLSEVRNIGGWVDEGEVGGQQSWEFKFWTLKKFTTKQIITLFEAGGEMVWQSADIAGKLKILRGLL